MRDPELLLTLLRQMAEDQYGRFNHVRTLGMSEAEQRVDHHLELLRDAGHVEWIEGKFPRITNAGYDLIEAVDKNPKIMDAFMDTMKRGVPYIQAAAAALKLLS